jgi:F-type H+/Na+-transporting ATPase subunit alpha
VAQKAAAAIPEDVIGRLVSADALGDADRRTIVDIARKALAG